MSLVSDNWKSNLVQTGPPPWANNPKQVRFMTADSVVELRKIVIPPSEASEPHVALLLGEFRPYDGQLQGFYLAYAPNRQQFPENGAQYIYSNLGDTLWRKLT